MLDVPMLNFMLIQMTMVKWLSAESEHLMILQNFLQRNQFYNVIELQFFRDPRNEFSLVARHNWAKSG